MKKKSHTFRSWLYKENVAGYVLAAPFILGFFAFILVPMGMSRSEERRVGKEC